MSPRKQTSSSAATPSPAVEEESETAYTVGDIVTVRPGGVVIGPDNVSRIVIKGAFYLDRPGVFLVDGKTVTVR